MTKPRAKPGRLGGNLALTGAPADLDATGAVVARIVAGRSPAASIAETLRAVPVEALTRSPWQPRRQMDPERLEELAESIRSRGVLEPLLAREVETGSLGGQESSGGSSALELLAGERRLLAARLAGLLTVPVRVFRGLSDAEAREVALVENLARADLTAWEEAGALVALREARRAEDRPADVRTLAGIVGRSKTLAAELLAIGEMLTPEVLEAASVRTPDKLPHQALYGAARGATDAERARLLALYAGAPAPGRAAAERTRRGRAGRAGAKPYTLTRRDGGGLTLTTRRAPEELALALEPAEAKKLLEVLAPIVTALRTRAAEQQALPLPTAKEN